MKRFSNPICGPNYEVKLDLTDADWEIWAGALTYCIKPEKQNVPFYLKYLKS
jgi:hypothetical protein